MTMASISPLAGTLYVALGGAIGAAARYHVGLISMRWAGSGTQFPWGTFTVNIVGSLIMGGLLGWFARGGAPAEGMRVFLIAGLMGGFTTFSAFSAELVTMVHRGQFLTAGLYGGGSLVVGMIAFLVGLIAVQSAQ